MLKKVIKLFIPPVFYKIKQAVGSKANGLLWIGEYLNWEAALIDSKQYDDASILEKVRHATMQVKTGEAAYERDSVVFDKIQYSWPLIACLQKVALENKGQLNLIDFGGSLGSSYYQNKDFLNLKSLVWNVVEQPSFVEVGQKEFEDDFLKFYYKIEDIPENGKIANCILLSSVLPYLEEPEKWIKKISGMSVKYILIDRTGFVQDRKVMLTVQSVPEQIYSVSYPCWFFNEQDFLNSFTNYQVVTDFDDVIDPPAIVNGVKAYWKGFLLKLND